MLKVKRYTSLIFFCFMISAATCFAKCDYYYIIVLNTTDGHAGSLYKPIQKSDITWKISKLHMNGETIDFDMSCVLDLYCQNVTIAMTNDFVGLEDGSSIAPTVIDMKTESTPTNTTDIKITKMKEDTEPTEETSYTATTVTHKEDGPTSFTSTIKTDIKMHSTEKYTSPTEETAETESAITKKENYSTSSEIETVTGSSTIPTSNEDAEATSIATVLYLETITTEDVYSTDPNNKNKEGVTLFSEPDDVATTAQTISDLHQYDPEKSKAVANKVMAGVVGALAAVGVCILVKFAANKAVEYCAHSGVYRLPDP